MTCDSPDFLTYTHTKKNILDTVVWLQLFGGQLDEDFLSNSGAIERGSKCFGCSHQSSLSWTDCHCCLWISQTHHTAISYRCLLKPPLLPLLSTYTEVNKILKPSSDKTSQRLFASELGKQLSNIKYTCNMIRITECI